MEMYTPSVNVAISDTSLAILELEREVLQMDSAIRQKTKDLLNTRRELSTMVTQRDVLIATINQISEYRNAGTQRNIDRQV